MYLINSEKNIVLETFHIVEELFDKEDLEYFKSKHIKINKILPNKITRIEIDKSLSNEIIGEVITRCMKKSWIRP